MTTYTDLKTRLGRMEAITMPGQPFRLETVRPWLEKNAEIRREALAAIEELEARNQWQPIETAYQEGVMHPDETGNWHKRVLLFYPSYGAMSGHWDGLKWVGHSCLNREAKPTHWKPLPPPPETPQ